MIRVYELARELKISNKDLIEHISSLNVHVGSHMSCIADEIVKKIKKSSLLKRNFTKGCHRKGAFIPNLPPPRASHAPESAKSKSDVPNPATPTPNCKIKPTKIRRHPCTETPAADEAKNTDPICDKTFIIDAMNVCRGFSQNANCACMGYLLALVKEIADRKGTFLAIFDANAKYVFEEYSADDKKCFEFLRKHAGEKFSSVPGRSKADRYILDMASRNNYAVISNDQFRDYKTDYPWVATEPDRLFRGSVFMDPGGNGKQKQRVISIPELAIYASIPTDLIASAESIIALLN
jgi:hypothetical protein